MVKFNFNTNRLEPEEIKRRQYFTHLDCSTFVPPSGILPIVCSNRIRFNLKKTMWDPKGNIDGFFVEEDIRKQFFYPYLPCNFIDVGAAHGSWTLPAIAAGSDVVGFEIDPRYHSSFRENILANNNFDKHVKLFSMGLADKQGIGCLFELEDIQFAPLDVVMRDLSFAPQYIKIDVEGLEKLVLKGAVKTIDLYHPKLFIEVHYETKYTEDEKKEVEDGICDILRNYDYKIERGRGEKSFTYYFFT